MQKARLLKIGLTGSLCAASGLQPGVHVHHSGVREDILGVYPKQTPWPESENELYRPSDRRLSVKLVPTFADRRCRVV
jgi:hypothetical protein